MDQQKQPVITNAALYERDFYAWCHETATLVRTGQWDAMDAEALAEELESMGRSEKRALESDLEVLLVHLLKWQYQPLYRAESHSWFDTIVEHRSRILRLLRDNPSLKPQVSAMVAEVYPTAYPRALGQISRPFPLKLSLRDVRMLAEHYRMPPQCPWTPAQVLDPDFWPA